MGNTKKKRRIPRGIRYDDGGWLSEDATNDSYNKTLQWVSAGAGIAHTAGQLLQLAGAMQGGKGGASAQGALGLGAAAGGGASSASSAAGSSNGNVPAGLNYVGNGNYGDKGPRWDLMANAWALGYSWNNGAWSRANGGPIVVRAQLRPGCHLFGGGGMQMAGAIVDGVAGAADNFVESSKTDDAAINQAKGNIKTKINQLVTSNSLDNLMTEYSADRKLKTDYNYKDFLGESMGLRIAKGQFKAANDGFSTFMGSGNIWAGIGAAAAGTVANLWGSFRAKHRSLDAAAKSNKFGFTANKVADFKYADRANLLDAQNDRARARGWYAGGGTLLVAPSQLDNAIGYAAYNDALATINRQLQNTDKDEELGKVKNGSLLAKGGPLKSVGIDASPISSLSEGLILLGVSEKEMAELRRLGYEFDIIGD